MRILLYLSLLCFINVNLIAQTQKTSSQSKTSSSSDFTSYFSGKKSIQMDYGYSANLLLSDFSTNVSAIGQGSQFSIVANLNTDGRRGAKISLMRVNATQHNFRKSVQSESPKTYYRSFSQSWNLLGIGLETRKSNRLLRWYWDWSLGYAFGRDSDIDLQEDGIGATESSFTEASRSFLFVGAGAGIRRSINKRWSINGSLRSFMLLGSIYGDQLKTESLVLLPLMASVGVELNF